MCVRTARKNKQTNPMRQHSLIDSPYHVPRCGERGGRDGVPVVWPGSSRGLCRGAWAAPSPLPPWCASLVLSVFMSVECGRSLHRRGGESVGICLEGVAAVRDVVALLTGRWKVSECSKDMP